MGHAHGSLTKTGLLTGQARSFYFIELTARPLAAMRTRAMTCAMNSDARATRISASIRGHSHRLMAYIASATKNSLAVNGCPRRLARSVLTAPEHADVHSYEPQYGINGVFDLCFGFAKHFKSETDILRHCHVRKQRIALKKRIDRALVRGRKVMSFSYSWMCPESGCPNPAISLRSVVLPQPDGPSKVKNSFSRISR